MGYHGTITIIALWYGVFEFADPWCGDIANQLYFAANTPSPASDVVGTSSADVLLNMNRDDV